MTSYAHAHLRAAPNVALMPAAEPARLDDAELDQLAAQAAYVEGDHNPRGRRVKAARQLADVIPELVSVIRELRSRGGAL